MSPIDRESVARALRRPRNRVLLGVAAFLLLLRIALPYALRPLIVAQADAALVGRIALDDLGLSLIRGGVELRGLAVYSGELPLPASQGSSAPPPEPPLFEARRLWTQISWFALLAKTIRVEEFELEGFAVRLDRTGAGLVLPQPAAPPEPPPGAAPGPAPEASPAASPPLEESEPSGWSFAADRVALRDGEIFFRDFTLGQQPQRFDLEVKDLSAEKLALVLDPSGAEPGHLLVSAQIGGGSIGLDAQLESRAAGPAVTSRITLANLPVGGIRAYLTAFGWSDLQARLDARIVHRFESGGAHEASGEVSLSDLAVRVPGRERPALAWTKLGVSLEKIDVAQQRADVAKVVLEGARVAVDLASKQPVLLLTPPAEAPPPPVPVQAPPAAAPAEPAKPWTWRVGAVQLEGATLDLLGGSEPLPLGVDVQLRDLSSEPASRWPLALAVSEGQGKLALQGALAVAPLAFDGKLLVSDLALAPLVGRMVAPGVKLLRQGSARADLAIALTPRPVEGGQQVAPGVVPPTDLRIAGTLGLAGLDVGETAAPREFGVAWKDFEIGIRELAVPELLGVRDPSSPPSIGVNLDRVRLVEPALQITRGEQGVVIPSLGAAPSPPAAPAAPAPAETAVEAQAPASAALPAAPATELRVDLAQASIEAARVQILDRAARPFYRSKIDRLDLRVRGVHWPGPRVENLALDLKGLDGATLTARGSVGPADSKVVLKLVGLPLAQFNSYVTPSGYSVAAGSLSLDSEAKLVRDTYDSSTRVVVGQLDVGGAEGESLFRETFGIPLSVALGLLKDLSGNISMSVPFAGDRSGAKVGLASIVSQALRKALVGALASPLKLLGAISADGKVEKLAPDPIAFVPGRAELAPEGGPRIEQLTGLLAASPGIALTLSGVVSASDVRVLQEQSLLEELRASSGVRALGSLGEIGTRRAVRAHLEAKLAGKEPRALDPQQSEWLERHATEQKLAPSALESLAAARASAAQNALVNGGGIAAERLAIGAPASDPPAAQPGVAVALGVPGH